MFGPRITTVFASRWRALWWSASILLMVYWFASPAENAGKDAKQDAQIAEAAKQVKNLNLDLGALNDRD